MDVIVTFVREKAIEQQDAGDTEVIVGLQEQDDHFKELLRILNLTPKLFFDTGYVASINIPPSRTRSHNKERRCCRYIVRASWENFNTNSFSRSPTEPMVAIY